MGGATRRRGCTKGDGLHQWGRFFLVQMTRGRFFCHLNSKLQTMGQGTILFGLADFISCFFVQGDGSSVKLLLRAFDLPCRLTARTVPPCPAPLARGRARGHEFLSCGRTDALSLWDSSLIDGMHSIEPCFSHSSSFGEVNQVTVPACRPPVPSPATLHSKL